MELLGPVVGGTGQGPARAGRGLARRGRRCRVPRAPWALPHVHPQPSACPRPRHPSRPRARRPAHRRRPRLPGAADRPQPPRRTPDQVGGAPGGAVTDGATHPSVGNRRIFWPSVLVGWGLISVGIVGLLGNTRDTHPANFARLFAGVLLLHDALLAPLV